MDVPMDNTENQQREHQKQGNEGIGENDGTVEEVQEHHGSDHDINADEETEEEKISEDQTTKVDPALIDALTNGFLGKVLPDLESSKTMLEELMRNQRILIDTVQQENSKFNECQAFRELGETMLQSKQYHAKLVNIKKEMNNLHEKSARLKKRALKLQQQKQKEELQRAHQRDKEIEREKMLVAKPASAQRQQSTQSTLSTGSQSSDTDIPAPSYTQ